MGAVAAAAEVATVPAPTIAAVTVAVSAVVAGQLPFFAVHSHLVVDLESVCSQATEKNMVH